MSQRGLSPPSQWTECIEHSKCLHFSLWQVKHPLLPRAVQWAFYPLSSGGPIPLEACLLNQQCQVQIRQASYYLQLRWNVWFLKTLSWMNRSQTNNNKKWDLSKVFSQKCLINWLRSPQTRDAALGSATCLLCDLGPVNDPLCVLGCVGKGLPKAPSSSDSLIRLVSAIQNAFRMSNVMFSCSLGIAFV